MELLKNVFNCTRVLNYVFFLLVIRTIITIARTMLWRYLKLRYKSAVLRNSKESLNDLRQPGFQQKRRLLRY